MTTLELHRDKRLSRNQTIIFMKAVFVHHDPTVVGFKKSFLEEAGIDCFIRNENTSATFGAGALGLVQSSVFDPALCIVDDSRYDEAVALLKTTAEPSLAVRADWRCPKCGESVPGNFETCWNCPSMDFHEPFDRRIDERSVAKVLHLIATAPNRRERPIVGDVSGAFDFWFDGGAASIQTGYVDYQFADGTRARLAAPIPALSVTIDFPNGCRVRVQQES